MWLRSILPGEDHTDFRKKSLLCNFLVQVLVISTWELFIFLVFFPQYLGMKEAYESLQWLQNHPQSSE